MKEALSSPSIRTVGHTGKTQLFPISGSREPSGAVWIPHLQGYLVVDDEPKATSDQMGLFFYRVLGKSLRQVPLRVLAQKRRWNDWEGVTVTEQDVVLLTSHSQRRKKRTQLCRFPLTALQNRQDHIALSARLHCTGGKHQRDQIQQVIRRASRRFGFSLEASWESRGAKQGGLDLEGIAYDAKLRLFWIGLRGPLVRKNQKDWAVLLTMQWEQGQSPVFRMGALLHLQGRGIRDITQLPSGEFLLIAGPVGNRGRFDLFQVRLNTVSQGVLWVHSPRRVTPSFWPTTSWFQPEALGVWQNQWFVWSDSGDWDTPRPAHALRIK